MASGLPANFSGPRGYVQGVDDTSEAKEPFQANIIQLGGTVHGSKGRGHLNYLTLGGGTPGQAWNMARVQERAGVPVWVGFFQNEPVIMALDKSRMEPNGFRGYRSPLFAQHAPDHGWGSGDPDYVDTRRLRDLMVRPAGGFLVNISPGRYISGSERVYFPGQQNYDLSAHQPAVAGTKRRVGLYLDAANTVQEVTGSLFAVTAPLPELVWPAGAFPLISFILYESKDFIDFEYVKQEKILWGSPSADEKVKVNADDTTADYLQNKMSSGIEWFFVVEQDIGGNKYLEFQANPDIDEFSVSKLVSPDGATDPVLSADNAGDVAAVGDLSVAGDVFIGGDEAPVFQRSVNFYHAPDEHWPAGSDQLTWTGWASYTGFATPATITRANSQLSVTHGSATKAFYYKSFINNQAQIYTVCGVSLAGQTGLMLDDGVNNADGLGANNFVRIFIEYPTAATNANLASEYRTGGGAVTKATFLSLPPQNLVGISIQYGVGTRWSNWTAQIRIFGTAGITTFIANIATGLTWTPVRHGLYTSIGVSARTSVWDWFEEAG